MFGRKKKKAKERSGAAGSADGDTESETSLISQSFNIQSRASEVSAPSSPAPSLGRLVPEAGAPDTLNRGGRPAYGNSGNAGGPAISDKKIMELDAKLKDNINVFENAILGLDERRQRFIDMERKSLQLDESVKIFRKSASDAKNKMWKKNMKMCLILFGVIIAAIIILIIVFIPKGGGGGGGNNNVDTKAERKKIPSDKEEMLEGDEGKLNVAKVSSKFSHDNSNRWISFYDSVLDSDSVKGTAGRK